MDESDRPMLIAALQKLAATGPSGFEGLIQRLLGQLTGYQFYLAQAGMQQGRDMSSDRVNATVLAVECKRYGDDTELKISELLGKLAQAVEAIPQLDVWVLVASRPVPDQVYSALQQLADRIHVDVQVLAAGEEFPSSLEVLCANSADILVSDLRSLKVPNLREIESDLQGIASHSEFSRKRERLKALFTDSAGYDAARRRLGEWLLGRFSSDANARAALGQAVDVEAKREAGRLVRRVNTDAKLDEWLNAWPTHRVGLAVLGEEGDGKTWAVASWLAARLYADITTPPTLWLPSREVVTQDFEALVGDALVKRLGGRSDGWIERLRRWSPLANTGGPSLLLVLDGINERHDHRWWRPIIEALGADPWRNAIAPIVTARTGFWPALARLPHIRWANCTVAPFDDTELNLALDQIGVRREELPSDILKLVRKPRYFDLTVRHRAAMTDSGDITVARLIYEDWSDRESRRGGLPSETDFQNVIMDLALKQRQGHRTLEQREILDAVGGSGNRDGLLHELETSGVLVQDGRHWRVDPSRLSLGFGLLLAERLRDQSLIRDPAEVLASLMEPQPDIDLKAAILENATLHSLETAGFSTSLRSVLLAAWLTHRNPTSLAEHSVAAYFPLDPSAYLSAAERIWADSTDDGWAEQLLRSAYGRWSGTPRFASEFAQAFERWLGFVHVDGSPVGVQPQDRPTRRAAVAAIVGKELLPGQFEYAGTNLTAIEDEGLLRLGRVALAIISEGDRRPYVRAVMTAFVADALMQYPDRLDLCRWIIRTSQEDLRSLLESEAQRLITIGSRTTLQAAYRLLGCVGTTRALELREQLPNDLFPNNRWFREHEADPCASGFAWDPKDCARCAGRDDVPVHIMAQQLEKCVRNPEFKVPETTRKRLVAFLREIDTSRIWSGPFTTEQEHRLDTIELAISSCDPGALAVFVRAIAQEAPKRQGLALRQLAFQLQAYRLLLSADELTTIGQVWDTLARLDRSDDRENERAEWALFELAIQDLSPEEQLHRLLDRKPSALVLTRFRRHFKPIPWSEVAERLRRTSEPTEISRILFFASANPGTVDANAVEPLRQYITNPDPDVRFLALRLVYIGKLEEAAVAVVMSDWHFNGQDERAVHEDHWGSLILAKWGHPLSYEELRTRIQPTLIGRAIANRGSVVEEVERYSQDLDHVWSRLGKEVSEPDSFPTIEVSVKSVARTDELELPGVAHGTFSRSMTYLSRHASWGGHINESPMADFIKAPSDEDLEQLHETLRKTLASQRNAQNSWFAQRFDPACLADVIRLKPELVSKWVGDQTGDRDSVRQRVWLARSFYEALCEVLLTEVPARGAALYRFLQKQSGAVRFVEHGTSIPLLDYALFDAKECDEIQALWEQRLEDARTDRDLLVVSILAQAGTASSWLSNAIARDLASHIPFRKVRAILLGGFVAGPTRPSEPVSAAPDVIEWQRQEFRRALGNWKTNQWARMWFEKFSSDASDDVAIGAFRLFLSCVDSRFSLWRTAGLSGLPDRRRQFVLTSGDEIERAIRKNEQDFRKNFLGMRVAERQVWPWT